MKNSTNAATLIFFFLCFFKLQAQWQVASPDGKLLTTIQLDGSGEASYKVDFIENTSTNIIAPSYLGLQRNDCDFRSGLSFSSLTTSTINENYQMVTGKQLSLQNQANELTLSFTKCNVIFNIIFRAYNDGIAFRYSFPQTSSSTFVVDNEYSTVKVSTNGKAWMQKNVELMPANESIITEVNIGQSSPDFTGWCLPALLNPNSHWVMITEADLDRNFFGSHIAQYSPNGEYKFEKPIRNDGTSYSNNASFSTPMRTPWRVVMIGNTVKTIIESNIVSHLSSPSTIANTSWIKPAMST